jgi:hypothetical protein
MEFEEVNNTSCKQAECFMTHEVGLLKAAHIYEYQLDFRVKLS